MKIYLLLLMPAILLLTSCTMFPRAATFPSPAPPPAISSTAQLPDKRLIAAKADNPDSIAWLTIPGTTIDGAVQQSEDNDYYLRRDALGNISFEGCYFADFESIMTSAYALSPNTVLYGHTFEGDDEKRFFAQLWRLAEDERFAKDNRTIYLSLQDAMTKWEIISIGVVDAKTDTFAITANPTTVEMRQLLAAAKERSLYDFDFSEESCDKILTLSTCTDDDATRLVVVAKPKTK